MNTAKDNTQAGWDWKREELLDSWIKVLSISNEFCALGNDKMVNLIYSAANQNARLLIYPDIIGLKNRPLDFLAGVVERSRFCFEIFTNPNWLTENLPTDFGTPPANPSSQWVHRRTFMLYNAFQTLDFHNCAMLAAYDEILRRVLDKPLESWNIGGIKFASDTSVKTECYKETMAFLLKITQKYQLPADANDEKESILDLALGELLHTARNTGSGLEWLENKGDYAIKDILQKLQNIIRNQEARKRATDHKKNKVYLDQPLKDANNQTLGDRLEASAPDLQNTPLEWTKEQIRMATEAFGKNGARVLDAIYKDPDATQAEIANALSISISTVEKLRKRFRENPDTVKEILGV